MSSRKPRPMISLETAAWPWLAIAIGATVLRIVNPFEHGIWLVAYLSLVGWLAQLLLGRGRRRFASRDSDESARRETALWNLGVVLVPAGVLLDVRLLVAAGSVALLLALALIAAAVATSYCSKRPGRGAAGIVYACLIGFMLISTGVGMALTADVPWL